MRWAVGAAAAAIVAAAVGWFALPAPVVLNYSIEAQRMKQEQPVGDPYIASPGDVFEAGWKFRLAADSPKGGYLYLINDGPDQSGSNRLWVLYPPASNAGTALTPSRATKTGWFVFDRNPGTERLWVVWSAQPVAEFAEGKVSDPAAEARLRTLLAGMASLTPASDGPKLALRTSQDLAGTLVALQHR